MNLRTLLLWCVRLYAVAWALDYRGTDEGGSAVIFLLFGGAVALGGVVMLIGWRSLFVKPVGWLLLLWGGYLLSSVVVAAVNHVSPAWYLRNVLPPLLVFTGMGVTQVAAACGFSYKNVLYPMLAAGTVNVIWRAFYALFVAGIPVDQVRIEMLSPCLPFLLGYMFCALALSRRIPWVPAIIGGIGIMSYVVSVTRSALFIVAAALFGAVIALYQSRKMGVLPRGFATRKIVHAVAGAALVAVALIMVSLAVPVVGERWNERLFHTHGGESSSADPSALTRFAETRAFIDLLNAEPVTWVYGLGLGQGYYWDESYAVELAAYTYGNEDQFRATTMDVHFPGHSIWTYAVFSGGILGLLCYVALFGGSTWLALRSARQLPRAGEYPPEIAWLPFLGLLAFLSQSLTINPFIERTAGLVLGLTMGLPQFLYYHVWARGRVRASQPQTWIAHFAAPEEEELVRPESVPTGAELAPLRTVRSAPATTEAPP